jgi:VanZ family protein
VTRRLQLAARVAAACAVALAAWLSLTPTPPVPTGLPSGADLVVHFLMHAGVAWLVFLGWRPGRGPALLVLALAVALEAGQSLSPGRVVSALDLAMNLAGALAGAGAAVALRRVTCGRRRG